MALAVKLENHPEKSMAMALLQQELIGDDGR